MVDSGNASPVDRARAALQRVDDLCRVAISRLILLRELFDRRHLRSADSHGLDDHILDLREEIEISFDVLLDSWADFSARADYLASPDGSAS